MSSYYITVTAKKEIIDDVEKELRSMNPQYADNKNFLDRTDDENVEYEFSVFEYDEECIAKVSLRYPSDVIHSHYYASLPCSYHTIDSDFLNGEIVNENEETKYVCDDWESTQVEEENDESEADDNADESKHETDGAKKFDRRKRFAKTRRAKRRLRAIARNSGWHLGPYEKDDGRVVNSGRGKRSKYLKNQSNRKLRRDKSEDCLNGGEYKRKYDYWWELT